MVQQNKKKNKEKLLPLNQKLEKYKIKDFHYLYLKCADVLLLADVLELLEIIQKYVIIEYDTIEITINT